MSFPSLRKLCLVKIIESDQFKIEKKYSMGKIIELNVQEKENKKKKTLLNIFKKKTQKESIIFNSPDLINDFDIVGSTLVFYETLIRYEIRMTYFPYNSVDLELIKLIKFNGDELIMTTLLLEKMKLFRKLYSTKTVYVFKNSIAGICLEWLRKNRIFERFKKINQIGSHYLLIQYSDRLDFIEKHFDITKDFNENLNLIPNNRPGITQITKKNLLINYLIYNDIYISKFKLRFGKNTLVFMCCPNISQYMYKEKFMWYLRFYNETNIRKDLVDYIYHCILNGKFNLTNSVMKILTMYPEYLEELKKLQLI